MNPPQQTKTHWPPLLLLVFLGVTWGGCRTETKPAPAADEITTTFVVMGDNRLGKGHYGPGDSSANVAQLRQNLRDIAALDRKPAYIFFNGDLVDNAVDDQGQTLKTQLDAWYKLFREISSECKLTVPLVPLPGNHESLRVVVQDGKPMEKVNPYTYPVWADWLKRTGLGRYGGNGPLAVGPNPDLLAGDNRLDTYSFDDAGGNHFIAINSDTLSEGTNPPVGWIAAHWIAEDVKRAEANPKVRNIFAFAHKPIRLTGFPFDPTGSRSIFNSDDHPLAKELQDSFAASTKFRAFLCSHLHLWGYGILPDTTDLWQVIVGNAGAPLILQNGGPWQAPYYFGFTVVQIHRDGRVGIVSYNRPVPNPQDSPAPQPPAQPQPEIMLPRSTGTTK